MGPPVNGREREKGQAAGDGHHDTSSIHVHVGLVRLHAHGSHILYRVVMFVALYRPYAFTLSMEIKTPSTEGKLCPYFRVTGLTSQPSIHMYGSVGSVIHRDV
jgi:hypothetical protein